MIPAGLLDEHREGARLVMEQPTSWWGAALIISVWLVVAAVAADLAVRWLGG